MVEEDEAEGVLYGEAFLVGNEVFLQGEGEGEGLPRGEVPVFVAGVPEGLEAFLGEVESGVGRREEEPGGVGGEQVGGA